MFNIFNMEYRLQQQMAHEIYHQQIMQRIPDPFPQMLPMGIPHHVLIAPPCTSLPGNVEAKLENDDLWQQFHTIGTEMIITKNGRRMFPSLRVSLKGLEEEAQYCVLLEMVSVGDCRYKFSGSQWVPAGGAEPQSPQRMFLHPDSPASGSHWQSQTILFNKVKLTNNTMDDNGHIVLTSMHKYQPRFHIIKTCDLSRLRWAPQQNFMFPETEFIAVTAYQNDRITKLKIDNNPFAKGFRETGQSKCKRKMMLLSSSSSSAPSQQEESDDSLSKSEDDRSSISSADSPPRQKLLRSLKITADEDSISHNFAFSPHYDQYLQAQYPQHQMQMPYLSPRISPYYYHQSTLAQQHLQSLLNPLKLCYAPYALLQASPQESTLSHHDAINVEVKSYTSASPSILTTPSSTEDSPSALTSQRVKGTSQKISNFRISDILAY